ncbi:CPBP family intramembrane glutamic endopeptidase [Bacteroides sp.]
MKTAIKLILIYLGLQLACGAVVSLFIVLASLVQGVQPDANAAGLALAPTMLLSMAIMFVYLWKAGYLPSSRKSYSIVSVPFMIITLLTGVSLLLLMDFLTSLLSWLPNLMEEQFNMLQSGWLGILSITILGPILEELLFRGAVTRILLEKYEPKKAILWSAILFGVFHLNPAQIVGAFFGGLVFAWIYYRTRSLLPCILIHILINSSSVILTLNYPGVDNIIEIVGATPYYIMLFIASALFVVCLNWMKRNTQNSNTNIK